MKSLRLTAIDGCRPTEERVKRILVISDLHCGHVAGLTPPSWQTRPGEGASRNKQAKFAAIQKEAWNWYVKHVEAGKPYDLVVCNGDAIDGRGERSGGTELVAVDRYEQAQMAEVCIQKALTSGTKLVMVVGTPYHVGVEEDWEALIASDLNALKIGSHEWVTTEGVTFDFKHHVGSSSVPYGRHTPVAKEGLWSDLWANEGLTPKSDVVCRSHVHHFQYAGTRKQLRLTTPALQSMGSKYGSRRCSGLVDFGFIVFEVQDGTFDMEPVLAELKSERAKAIRV